MCPILRQRLANLDNPGLKLGTRNHEESLVFWMNEFFDTMTPQDGENEIG